MSAYTVFNNVVQDFVEAMLEKFPGSKELAACGVFHKMSVCMDTKMAYQKFREYVLTPYEKPLRDHDDSFFLDQSYAEMSEKDGMIIISALKHLWREMSDEDKKCVYGYIDLILEIHERISNDV